MRDLDAAGALVMGGWDARFAVVLAVATRDSVAAAVVDTNGDGADIDVDLYTRGPAGEWVGIASGNGDVGSTSWNHEVSTLSGWATPGSSVTVEYVGVRHRVVTASSGCWLFVASTGSPDKYPHLSDGPSAS